MDPDATATAGLRDTSGITSCRVKLLADGPMSEQASLGLHSSALLHGLQERAESCIKFWHHYFINAIYRTSRSHSFSQWF
jgi:hypothetical protein